MEIEVNLMKLTNVINITNAEREANASQFVSNEWLMNRAAEALATQAKAMCPQLNSCVLVCGIGNNGGDGFALASILEKSGVRTRVILIGKKQKMTKDTKTMFLAYEKLGGTVETLNSAKFLKVLSTTDLVVDAIFGIGINRPVTDEAKLAIELMNSMLTPVLAVDIPSGIEADTGNVLGVAVEATATVAFSLAKCGHFVEQGSVHTGKLIVADIGIEEMLLDEALIDVEAIYLEDLSFPRRKKISHKGDYGKVLIVGGSVGYTGAVSLAAKAALRSGAGLVSVAVPENIYEITAIKNDEAMPFPLKSDTDGKISLAAYSEIMEKAEICDVLAIGMGLGRSDELSELVCKIIENANCQLVLDADALYAIKDKVDVLKKAKYPVILTPHEAEFKRLYPEMGTDRLKSAMDFAKAYNSILVLKGHRTIVAFSEGLATINTNGNAGMAKGGTGDVLAGIIAAISCVVDVKEAVKLAVFIHGRAGDLAACELGEHFMTASDIINYLSCAIKEVKN